MIDEIETGTLAGRVVELRSVGFGYVLETNRLREEKDAWTAQKFICVHSAHWADTGERVFSDLAALDAWPMRDGIALVDLINKAGKVNSLRDTAMPNGADPTAEAPRPSH